MTTNPSQDCAYPGDHEHDHRMCQDAVAAGYLAVYEELDRDGTLALFREAYAADPTWDDCDPEATVDRLGGQWSQDIDAYAAGRLDAAAVRCALCGHAPCDCPPFGTPAYFAMLDRVHGRNR